MNLTSQEIAIILEALSAKYGFGYSSVKEVGQLQAKLSIMAEVTAKREAEKDIQIKTLSTARVRD